MINLLSHRGAPFLLYFYSVLDNLSGISICDKHITLNNSCVLYPSPLSTRLLDIFLFWDQIYELKVHTQKFSLPQQLNLFQNCIFYSLCFCYDRTSVFSYLFYLSSYTNYHYKPTYMLKTFLEECGFILSSLFE